VIAMAMDFIDYHVVGRVLDTSGVIL